MKLEESLNIHDLLRESETFGPAEIEMLEEAVGSPQVSQVRQEIHALQAEIDTQDRPSKSMLIRVGIGSYLLGEHARANRILSQVDGDGQATFYHALALLSLGRYQEAAEKFQQAASQGGDPVECTLRQAGAVRALGQLDEAESLLRSVASEAASRAEYSFQMGCILSDRGDTFGAVEYFERAVDMDPHHSRALFWLAGENALRGNDDEAIRLYEQSLSKPPFYTGALLNLGLLYEDKELFSAAAYCFHQILEYDPNNDRAYLYLKDIEASSDMYYDEDSVRHEARMKQLLNRPVSDFELSARSRNCLQSMGIRTLGDLTRISEQDLLASKNFGETSLYEVRNLMQSHRLQIGQNVHEAYGSAAYEQSHLAPEERALLNRPVSELNLSVRARKCMNRLGINTIGQLIQKTADELLSSRNFGVTSLNEIRGKLAEHDLKLRGD